jgi:UDP-N-acetylglucosamine 1-carboxyvinyltransferase
VIRGVERLSSAPVRALDIRAGAAMVIAALMADGVTEIDDMYHVDRGYQDLEAKLTALGAVVRRERERSPPSSDPRASRRARRVRSVPRFLVARRSSCSGAPLRTVQR